MQLPLTPALTLKSFLGTLTSYEQSEILEYKEIFYIGPNAKKVKTDIHSENYGFDD